MQKKQFGRSMIEMLGVLAIIGVLSIGGILGYRRAVNNHQANTILDDVNRFAFVILERSGLALGEVIPKGDFVESGIYNLRGYQSEEAQGFSITVQNVPHGVCEALLPKAAVEYKVGVVTAGGSVDNEIIYDTLNTNLCQDTNDIAFYFGDTSGVCNEPDESGYTPCTTNADCCGDYFCYYPNTPPNCRAAGRSRCEKITETNFVASAEMMLSGHTWVRSENGMNWWSAKNWCKAQGKQLASRADLGCEHVPSPRYCTEPATAESGTGGTEPGPAYEGSVLRSLQDSGWLPEGYFWLVEDYDDCYAFGVRYAGSPYGYLNSLIFTSGHNNARIALCH